MPPWSCVPPLDFCFGASPIQALAGRLALELVDSLLPPGLQGVQGLDRVLEEEEGDAGPAPTDAPFDLPAALDQLARLVRRPAFGPTTRSLVEEAERRGIPVMRLDEHSLVQFGWGRHRQFLRASVAGRTSHIAVESAGDKDLTKALLAVAGV